MKERKTYAESSLAYILAKAICQFISNDGKRTAKQCIEYIYSYNSSEIRSIMIYNGVALPHAKSYDWREARELAMRQLHAALENENQT